jgi:hypothetical protein
MLTQQFVFKPTPALATEQKNLATLVYQVYREVPRVWGKRMVGKTIQRRIEVDQEVHLEEREETILERGWKEIEAR